MGTTSHQQDNQQIQFWPLLLVLFFISFVSGIIGFQHYFRLHGIEHDFIRSLYSTLQLYVFESGELTGFIPWELHLARFTAPLVPIIAFIFALLQIFRDQWNKWKISRMKDHVVVIGLGTKGKKVMQEQLAKGCRVLVIDIDDENPNIGYTRRKNCRLLIGDSTNSDTLDKGNIKEANTIFLLCGDDSVQVTSCLNIYQIIRDSNRNRTDPLICIMHLHNQEFLGAIKNHHLFKDATDAFVLSVFNVYENSARNLFENDPPDRHGIGPDSPDVVQILVFGFGMAGQALVLQTASTAHYANGKKSRIVIIDRLADTKVPDFVTRFPALKEYCELHPLTLDANSPQLMHTLSPFIDNPDTNTSIVLCFDNDTQNLLLAMQLDNILKDKEVKIFIRTFEDSVFVNLSENIKPYGLATEACSKELILGGDLDKKAVAYHEIYLEQRKKKANFGTKPADKPWEYLSQEYKDSNRKATDHIGVKMRAIGCDIVDINDPRPEAEFTKEEIELLSRLEHTRWCAERSLAGWTYGDPGNEKTRQTPNLTDWENLDKGTKDYDINAVKNIHNVLAKVGKKVVRKTLR